jgi:hypothetical protein
MDAAAFTDGQAYGEQVGLHRQMNGGMRRIPQSEGR